MEQFSRSVRDGPRESLRTVQRVEAEGITSFETTMALASALETTVADLSRREPLPPRGVSIGGTGTDHAESLHRIEPAAVREEVETAGFVLDAESTVLANRDDPHSIKVFDPSIKGATDRFAYRFVRL